MKFLYCCLLCLLPIQAALLAQSKNVRQIEALERHRFEAMTKKDIPFLKTVLADEMTYSHSNGLVETKIDHLENIQSGSLIYKMMEPEELEVQVYKKTAVLKGVINVSGTLKGKEFAIRLRYLDVYVKKKGKWQLVAWQSVRAE